MRNLLRSARRSQFLKDNAVYLFGSIAVGAFNYLYYPVLGRLLAPSAFGEVQTLVSLFLQLGIFLSVLGLVTVNIVANYKDEAQRNALVLEFEKLAFVLSLGLLALTIIFQSKLQEFLQFESPWPFVILMLSLVATVPFTFRGAFLRGKKRFGVAAISNVLGAAGKLLFFCAAGDCGAGYGRGDRRPGAGANRGDDLRGVVGDPPGLTPRPYAREEDDAEHAALDAGAALRAAGAHWLAGYHAAVQCRYFSCEALF